MPAPLRRLLPVLLLPLLLAAPLAADEPSAPVATAPKVTGRFETLGGHRVLTLWGTPEERGFAQGYLLAELIVDGISRDFERIMKPLLPLYKTLIQHVVVPKFAFSERELAEMRGLHAGLKAKLPPEKLVVNALGRAVELVDIKALNTFGDWYGLGCSSLAVWGDLTKDGATLVGRNFDFPAFDLVLLHQYVVVRAPEGDLQGQVGVSYPGCIGIVTGMNANGVFVAIHDVRVKPSLDKALRPNVPRLLAVRRLLEQVHGARACLEARDLARGWPTLYGNNLMVVAPERTDGVPHAAVLEYDCRADLDGGCTARLADRSSALASDAPPVVCLACTNHHRCRKETRSEQDGRPRWRYDLLHAVNGADKPPKPLDVAGLFGWMAKTAFPRDGKPQGRAEALRGEKRAHGTLHQCIAEPAAKRLHVRLGVLGRHISQTQARTYDVPALVQAATPKR